MKKNKLERFLEGYRFVKTALFIFILVTLTLMVAATMIARVTGGTPSVFGYSLFRVSSGSMEPELTVGDVVLVRDWDPLEMFIGDIITFQGEEGELKDKFITHRVVKPPYKDGDKYYIVTRGDANNDNDSPVETSRVIGKMITKVSFLRMFYDWFITPWGLLTIILIIILAFFNEIIVFVRSLLGHYDSEEEKNVSVEEIIVKYQKDDKKNEKEPEDQTGEIIDE